MGMKVAIVGLSPTTHDQAPWGDPSWQIWGLPWDEGYWQRMDRMFEMHDMSLLTSQHSKRAQGYLTRLSHFVEVPLYMQRQYFDTAIVYPFGDVAGTIGGAYWNSSIAYAMALAIHEGAAEIALYGVDMAASEEYAYQRPNMEYLIGIARGKGIKVTIPDESSLCKFNSGGIYFYDHAPAYIDRYGWLGGE